MSEPIDKDQFEMTLSVTEAQHGMRLDVVLAKTQPSLSRNVLQQWIRSGYVTIDGQVGLKPKEHVSEGQSIAVSASLQSQTEAQPQALALSIVFEDDTLLVINKPAGLVVHPGAGNPDHTLMNALLFHCPALSQLPRAGIIHRLDKDTSGLLVVPKTLEAHRHLVNQLQDHSMCRKYLALVRGTLIAGKTVDAPIGRHRIHRTKMTVTEKGKPATSHFRVKERFANHTLLVCQLETGRTHQIRVHCAWMKYPIVGDPVYNRRPTPPKGAQPELVAALQGFKRQALHAYELAFCHPKDNALHTFSAPIPDDMVALLDVLSVERL